MIDLKKLVSVSSLLSVLGFASMQLAWSSTTSTCPFVPHCFAVGCTYDANASVPCWDGARYRDLYWVTDPDCAYDYCFK
jgi:hypothetical protein